MKGFLLFRMEENESLYICLLITSYALSCLKHVSLCYVCYKIACKFGLPSLGEGLGVGVRSNG